jgi:3'-5' exoribonuclease
MPDYKMEAPKEYQGPYWRKEKLKELFPNEKQGIDDYYKFYDKVMHLRYLTTLNPNLINKTRLMLQALKLKKYFKMDADELTRHFFKDEKFLEEFKHGIGGVSMHHNYIGGLAEHTLGVMYLTTVLCERYDCRNKEIAVLGAKLHDIGKLKELDFKGPFKYTLEGELEGHIAIGVQMVDKAINEIGPKFSEDFIRRIKGCIIQHHGKLEYGSPRNANMEESFIINFADGIDATMNKIVQMKENFNSPGWTEYDRRLETKLYL